jgi:hypothetical protein
MANDEHTVGCYVYGIVESDVEVIGEHPGVGDPPAPIEIVSSGDVAALVSPVPLDRPLGDRSDLFAHQEILDATAANVAVLPMRFGAVVSSREAVVEDLLAPHRDEFASALRDLAGETQYVLRARYEEAALMEEIMAENPAAASLREQLRDQPEPLTRDVRIQLGEIVSRAVELKRAADTDAVIAAVHGLTEGISIRPPTHELDAAHVAMLVRAEREPELEQALTQLAQDWSGRAQVRLLGPMAAYDFVVTTRA